MPSDEAAFKVQHDASHHKELDSVFGDSLCFICGNPTDGGLYCSEDCRDVDRSAPPAAFLKHGYGPHHCSTCSSTGHSTPFCPSRPDAYGDIIKGVLDNPTLLLPKRQRPSAGTTRSFSTRATSSSSSSPLFSPVDASPEVPPIPDVTRPKSPFGIKPTSQTRSAGNGIRTPPLLALDSPSPQLRPVLRYNRRIYTGGTRSGIAALRRHARTPSGNQCLFPLRPPPESAPTSAVTSPVLLAQEGNNRACDDSRRKKKRNRRSLPLGLAGLSTSLFPASSMTPAAEPSLSVQHAHGLQSIHGVNIATVSQIRETATSYKHLKNHEDNSLRDATPTNLAIRLEALVLQRAQNLECKHHRAHSKTGLSAAESSSIDASSSLVSDLDLNPVEVNGRGRSPRDVRVDAGESAHWHPPTFSSSRSRTRSKSIRRQSRSRRRPRIANPVTPLELVQPPIRGRQTLRGLLSSSPNHRSQTTRPSSAVEGTYVLGRRSLLSPEERDAAGSGSRMRRRTEGRPQEYRDRGVDRERTLSAWLTQRKVEFLGSSDDEHSRGRSRSKLH